MSSWHIELYFRSWSNFAPFFSLLRPCSRHMDKTVYINEGRICIKLNLQPLVSTCREPIYSSLPASPFFLRHNYCFFCFAFSLTSSSFFSRWVCSILPLTARHNPVRYKKAPHGATQLRPSMKITYPYNTHRPLKLALEWFKPVCWSVNPTQFLTNLLQLPLILSLWRATPQTITSLYAS